MKGKEGLIGHTGFVGSNLNRQAQFSAHYNSSTIDDIRGRRFGLLVCAGVLAQKWIANREPENDRANIARLTAALDTVDADKFILISTIDVYPDPSLAEDEDTVIDRRGNHAYGRHRLELEDWVAGRFPHAMIVRLPALFGPGLKKNALYDLLHDNQTELINPAGIFQWYPIVSLWKDIERASAAGLTRINLFPEPLGMRPILDSLFADKNVGPEKHPAPRYQLRTKYSEVFGRNDGYIMSADECLRAIGEFVAAERSV